MRSFPELAPGRMFCIHVPFQKDRLVGRAIDEGLIAGELMEIANQQAKVAVLAHPAGWGHEVLVSSPDITTVGWLMRTANITESLAERIIAGLGNGIDEKLAYNAGVERSLLGVAAALTLKPDVLIYHTIALDQAGIRKVHQFVAINCRVNCAMHIDYPGFHGNGEPAPRRCPPGAICVDWGIPR